MNTKSAIFIMIGSMTVCLMACKYNKPSKEECEQAVNHITQLNINERQDEEREIAQRIADNQKDELLKTCTEKGTRKEIACILKAQTREEVYQCSEKNKPSEQVPAKQGET